MKMLKTSGNISYMVKTKNKDYLLRLSPLGPRWRSKEEIEAELELIEYLAKKSFPVIIPVKNIEDREIISWKNHSGYLRMFISGKAKLNPRKEDIKKFGKLLGRYHSLIENYKTKNKRKHEFGLAETLEYFKSKKRLISKGGAGNFAKKFEEEILLLDFPKNLPAGMVHEDPGKRHILWKKNKIMAVIDFDRCYYGKLILDLAQACRGWCFAGNWKKWSNENFKVLLEGYSKRRKLTKLEKKFLFNAIEFAILERALSFCVRFLKVTHDRDDKNYALHSINGKRGLLGMLKENKKEIEKIIRAA